MKKSEKYIYLILGVIVLGIVIAGVAFAVMKGSEKDNKTPNSNENNVDKPTNNDEKVTLTNEELEEYLSYIPKDASDGGFNAYTTPTNVNDIGNNVLLGKTLDYVFSLCDNETCERKDNLDTGYLYQDMLNVAVPKATIDDLMLKRYNLKYIVKENLSEMVTSYSATCFYYIDDSFIADTCSSSFYPNYLNVVDSYEATNDNLIIYEYAVTNDSTEIFDMAGDYIKIKYNKILDYYTDYSVDVYDICKYDTDCANNYFKEHKTDFTKYKHTFKKNDKGYYWYSTEVA